MPSLTMHLSLEFYYLSVQISANEFKSSCKLYPQVEAFLPYALPSSLRKSFRVSDFKYLDYS